ncbi:MAG TPA: hypothetical protein VHZ29_02015 [Rhizomicrobium sp.]|jgi:hypothetical protein|nr:hypothetical protein [Rhizomicrobium sp.]
MIDLADPKTAEIVTAFGTAFAALASIGSVVIAVGALLSQRRHDEASVMPIVRMDQMDFTSHLLVRLANHGVGPALIKSVHVKSAENGVTAKSIIELMPPLPDFNWATYARELEVIPSQQTLTLIEFLADTPKMTAMHTPQELDELLFKIRKALSRLTITISYTDVYQRKSWTLSNSLAWFGRRLSEPS